MKLYEVLTDEWLVLHNDQKALSDDTLCRFLGHCLDDILELTADQRALAKELLALDMLTFFRSASIPTSSAGSRRNAAGPTTSSVRKIAPPIYSSLPLYQLARPQDALLYLACQRGMKAELSRYGTVPDGPAYIIAEKQKERAHWFVIPAKGETL